MLENYKSPYGYPHACIRHDDDIWLCVKVENKDEFRYFHTTNWTYFEKDLATEITEEEYVSKAGMINDRIKEIVEERERERNV